MFDTSWIVSLDKILTGALTGLLFGFLLQRAGVTRSTTIVNQFLLRDFTVLKVMLTAIVVGSIGIYAMLDLGMLKTLQVRPATIYGVLMGGGIFGIGMAIAGYCPGTALAAIGDGKRDAKYVVLGGFLGAAIYAEVHPWFEQNINAALNLGKVTLADVTHTSHWLWIGGLVVVAGFIFWLIERPQTKVV
jgi:uncharacterized protein